MESVAFGAPWSVRPNARSGSKSSSSTFLYWRIAAPHLPYRLWMLAGSPLNYWTYSARARAYHGRFLGGAIASSSPCNDPNGARSWFSRDGDGMLMFLATSSRSENGYTTPAYGSRYLKKHFGSLYGGSARVQPALYEEFGRFMHSANWVGYYSSNSP